MTDVVRTCRRTWRRLGVPREEVAELAAELVSDIAAAAEDGVAQDAFVGGDARTFATEWATARALARPRPRLLATALAALVARFRVWRSRCSPPTGSRAPRSPSSSATT